MGTHMPWFFECVVIWALVYVCCAAVAARFGGGHHAARTWGGVTIDLARASPSTPLLAAFVFALATTAVGVAGGRGTPSDAGFQRQSVFFLAFHVVAIAYDMFPALRGGGGRSGALLDPASLRYPGVLYVVATLGTVGAYLLLCGYSDDGGAGDAAVWHHVDYMADHLGAPRYWVSWLLCSQRGGAGAGMPLTRALPGYACLALAAWGSARFLAASAFANWALCEEYGRFAADAADAAGTPSTTPAWAWLGLGANAIVCWVQAAAFILPRLYVWADETLVRGFGLHAKQKDD